MTQLSIPERTAQIASAIEYQKNRKEFLHSTEGVKLAEEAFWHLKEAVVLMLTPATHIGTEVTSILEGRVMAWSHQPPQKCNFLLQATGHDAKYIVEFSTPFTNCLRSHDGAKAVLTMMLLKHGFNERPSLTLSANVDQDTDGRVVWTMKDQMLTTVEMADRLINLLLDRVEHLVVKGT